MHGLIHPLILALFAALLLPACSAVRLGYGNADSLTRWWIDQYLDLSPEQDALTRERLARLTAWHRKTQLPDYVTLLRQGKAFAASQPKVGDALALGDELTRRVRVLAEQATPDVADLVATLTPAQIDRIAARHAEKNAELAKEMRLAEDKAAQHKARYKRLLERAEYWLGDFSDEQENALRRMVEARDPGGRFWLNGIVHRANASSRCCATTRPASSCRRIRRGGRRRRPCASQRRSSPWPSWPWRRRHNAPMPRRSSTT